MSKELASQLLAALDKRRLQDGGFTSREGGVYRPDATAWAILAMRAGGLEEDRRKPAQARLAADQQADGRLSVSPQHPEAFWPTCLAVLAWHETPAFQAAQARAVDFLLGTTGLHFSRLSENIMAHDTAIRGWPWIAQTHSWVDPTALCLIALRVAGQGGHERVKEGERMILDRQLADGGWNYGNTRVFGQKLHPMPESTGLALSALAERVSRAQVALSLTYLKEAAARVRTPLALGWSLLGLGAWGERPEAAPAWVSQCLRRQARYGGYDTAALSVLAVASLATRGLPSIFSGQIS